MEKWFSAELETITVACHDGSVAVPRLGQVAHISIYDKKSCEGPYADLILEPGDTERVKAIIEQLRLDPQAQRQALERPVAETLRLREVQLSDDLFTPTPEDEQRRQAALDWAFARFPLVEARMKEVYGLRLPLHIAVWAAFTRSLSPLEKLGANHLGRGPFGIMIWFEDNGLERHTRDGLDPRLECRYRADPPELVSVMGGNTDGLHFGLWYDDPAELPSCIASNYARDTAESAEDAPTVLSELQEYLRRRIEEPDYPDEPEPLCVHAYIAAVKWFQAADQKALADDGPRRWAEAPRGRILGGMAPALRPSHGNPRANDRDHSARHQAYRDKKAQPIIDEALRELQNGKPAYALVVGRELHWCDSDETREASLKLLTRAYDALGRHALAEIARVHHAHRDLKSVAVY